MPDLHFKFDKVKEARAGDDKGTMLLRTLDEHLSRLTSASSTSL